MTDAALARWEAAMREAAEEDATYGEVQPEDVLALIAEVRRLRAEVHILDHVVAHSRFPLQDDD